MDFDMGVFSYLNGVPVLAGERVDGLLLETLLALGQSLVPKLIKDPSALWFPHPCFQHRIAGLWKLDASVGLALESEKG